MNVRRMLAAATAALSAVLLSSCAVDGYSYYGTGYYDGGGSYCPPANNVGYYPSYNYYGSTRYYSSHGGYCPPRYYNNRPIVVVNDHNHNHHGNNHYKPYVDNSRPWNSKPFKYDNHGGSGNGGGNNHWSGGGSGNGGHNGGRPVFDGPRGGKPDSGGHSGGSHQKEERRGGFLMGDRSSSRSGRLGRD